MSELENLSWAAITAGLAYKRLVKILEIIHEEADERAWQSEEKEKENERNLEKNRGI